MSKKTRTFATPNLSARWREEAAVAQVELARRALTLAASALAEATLEHDTICEYEIDVDAQISMVSLVLMDPATPLPAREQALARYRTLVIRNEELEAKRLIASKTYDAALMLEGLASDNLDRLSD